MKIILEDSEKDYIKRINDGLSIENPLAVLCGEKKGYSISFDVVDIAKANAFIAYLMSPKKTKEIENILGIRVASVNYATGDVKLNELKHCLKKFLVELDNI